VSRTSLFDRLPGRANTANALRWQNWAGNQTCTPAVIERPRSEEQLQKIVRNANRNQQNVRVAASGHSFTAAVITNDVLVSLEHFRRVLEVDRLNRTVTVQAGIRLSDLNEQLANVGLAMTNMGDVAYQSVAGAISTGTHGTGLRFGGMATQVRGLRLMGADGEGIDASPLDNPELFHAARVSLGALGIITQVTLAVEPAFNLHTREASEPLADVLASWDERINVHDHFEFFFIPGTESVLSKSTDRTERPAQPRSRLAHFRDSVLFENVGFGAMCQLGRVKPSLIPKMTPLIASAVSDNEYIDRSDRILTSSRLVKFMEMEYSIPVAQAPDVLAQLQAEVTASNIDVLFPVEVRAVAADDIPLSTATGRDSAFIAVHMFKGREYRPYFELVERIMMEHAGRPHWGKMHFRSAESLAPLYPQWDEFQRVRTGVDPTGMFSNDYVNRVLGDGTGR